MPRRAAAQIRPVEPDSIHRNRLVQQVINKVMLDGKKSVAEKIVYDALAILAERSGKNPIEQLEARRARTLAVRWLVQFARQRREKTMAQRLANELLDAQQQQGAAFKRKDDIYRMAQANKAFAHYRW
jgi:small subunit ribosomal protein S7